MESCTNSTPPVFVMALCEYFTFGMKNLFSNNHINLSFIHRIEQVTIGLDDTLTIMLVLDMSGTESLRIFKEAVDFLIQINSRKRVGVLVSRYNSYLTHYISRKFAGKVTFFNSHNLHSGLFQRNFQTWLRGKTFRPMHTINRYRDERYGFSLKEWICLVLPLAGESIAEMSRCMKIPEPTLYQIRRGALKKLGLSSYRQFCELYIRGEIRTENDKILRQKY
ncbi:hypothetical protein FEK48_15530 [Escherichia sp. E2593]|uniref:hypothetical protein n=2 Tax=Escherichia TaxID=561 RepID=UPI0010296EC3|nr:MULTISPECIES: hypothetical protein [unclassified Escherichia]TLI63087.1 hypothetical protein FEK50_23875 [Escherichia sp. E2586]TLI77868.1 hypothetical protein FEK43_22585 [Escherichia sp. E2562]TLI80476.1 hypothetical protein FEK48_15530 [Escherichia sp. E2593]TLI90784.1 hypothetical protein FEK41_22310 [Escherichia sp. E4694]